ncbi:hypothetical protein HK102_000209 [Quaeritorhiza haematococci]|nr:hypothetical protein HK102_000209 [Quaeritorhiza haematococci]
MSTTSVPSPTPQSGRRRAVAVGFTAALLGCFLFLLASPNPSIAAPSSLIYARQQRSPSTFTERREGRLIELGDLLRKFSWDSVVEGAAGESNVDDSGDRSRRLGDIFRERAPSEEPLKILPGIFKSDNPSIIWNEALLQAIRQNKVGPTMCARSISIVHTCMYDAAVSYDHKAIRWADQNVERRPQEERTNANRRLAMSFAARRALGDLFPHMSGFFDGIMQELGYDLASASIEDDSNPAHLGNKACRKVLKRRHQDGSNQLGSPPYADTTGYVPINTPDQLVDKFKWQPLKIPTSPSSGNFTVQQFLTPHWYQVEPFALRSGDEVRPPFSVDEESYQEDVRELIEISASLTEYQKVVAEYWADGPHSELPPGHWTMFATFVSRRDHHSVLDDAFLFFALGNGLLDSSIAAWDAKRFYNTVRPITAVRSLQDQRIRAWAGPYQGIQEIAAKDWIPYQPLNVVTPPFPEFISGHSTFSACSARILQLFTSSDRFDHSATFRAGASLVEPGVVPAKDVTLRWSTFAEAAEEAGLSRLYGGIHFRNGDIRGRETGQAVAEKVFMKALMLFNGYRT